MAKAKSKSKPAHKTTPKAEKPAPATSSRGWPKATEARLKGARKIGVREEQIQLTLTPAEVEREREIVCDKLREIDRVKESAKTAASASKARVQELTEEKDTALGNANSRRRDVTIDVEEWLDSTNQVLRIRRDTGEIIGDRTARVDELQENLFDEDDEADEAETVDAGADSSQASDPPEATDPDGDFGDTANP